jgi:acylphosphatase
MKARVHVVIVGRVQGVFFRASTAEKADELGLTGWVKNTRDGNVEAVFEGEEGAVDEMVAWCHRGPAVAQVIKVEAKSEVFTGEFTQFSIRYK